LNLPPNVSNNFIIINPKLFRTIKDVIKFLQGKSKEENKKIEGTSFGFPRMALLDYPVIYLEKIFVKISSIFLKIKYSLGTFQIN